MSRTKRLYRLTATFSDYVTVRHYQSRKAAEHRRDVLLGRVEPDHGPAFDLDRAEQCVIDVSDPITWPQP